MAAFTDDRLSRAEVVQLVEAVRPVLDKGVMQWEVAGSYRRGAVDIGDVDFITTNAAFPALLRQIGKKLVVISTPRSGESVMTLLVGMGAKVAQVELLNVADDAFGAALMHSTGSANFNISLRKYAKQK